MAKIVRAVRAVVFQGIERCSCDVPPSTGSLHEPIKRGLVNAQGSHPTAMLDFAPDPFPAFDAMHPQLGIGLIERHPADKANALVNARFAVLTLILGDTTRWLSLAPWLAQKRRIALCAP